MQKKQNKTKQNTTKTKQTRSGGEFVGD